MNKFSVRKSSIYDGRFTVVVNLVKTNRGRGFVNYIVGDLTKQQANKLAKALNLAVKDMLPLVWRGNE